MKKGTVVITILAAVVVILFLFCSNRKPECYDAINSVEPVDKSKCFKGCKQRFRKCMIASRGNGEHECRGSKDSCYTACQESILA